MLENLKNKYNEKKKLIKDYLFLINNFSKLNEYVFLSKKCLNKIESILWSDLPFETKVDELEMVFSDFKNDFNPYDFTNGVNVVNKFDLEGEKDGR